MGTLYDLLKGTNIPGAGNRFWNWASKVSLAAEGGGGGGGDLIVENVLLVAKNGNDATGTRNDLSKPFLTVAAAVGAAETDDTVLIAPGEYVETSSILVSGKNLQIAGLGGLIIKASPSPVSLGAVVRFETGGDGLTASAGSRLFISNLTFFNKDKGYSVVLDGSELAVSEAVVDAIQAVNSSKANFYTGSRSYNVKSTSSEILLNEGSYVESFDSTADSVELRSGAYLQYFEGTSSGFFGAIGSSANDVYLTIDDLNVGIGFYGSSGGMTLDFTVVPTSPPSISGARLQNLLISSSVENALVIAQGANIGLLTIQTSDPGYVTLNALGATVIDISNHQLPANCKVDLRGGTFSGSVLLLANALLDMRGAGSAPGDTPNVTATDASGFWDRDQIVIPYDGVPTPIDITNTGTPVNFYDTFGSSIGVNLPSGATYAVSVCEIQDPTQTIAISAKSNTGFTATASGAGTKATFIVTRINT